MQNSANSLITIVKDQYQDLSDRLRALESQQIYPFQNTAHMLGSSSTASVSNDFEGSHDETLPPIQLAFEQDLAVTHVYRGIFPNTSISSVFSTEEPETTWSLLSTLSVADVASRIAVLNLTINSSEVYRPKQYTDSVAREPANKILNYVQIDNFSMLLKKLRFATPLLDAVMLLDDARISVRPRLRSMNLRKMYKLYKVARFMVMADAETLSRRHQWMRKTRRDPFSRNNRLLT